ncbi:BMP-binding endothelial regulator protein-like [Saccoglossus kowalevskii]|uniref:BMP-binding endothelial regulator protein-like n=1 Tax=Saccoglossus kowalevskii TaxID=10224 RepID=A0ABM0MVW9_SACKO|nr:PREDICTED: BMP-binding endothelial regulator protein-like [Saccoglossus kowalevskii]
MGSSSFIYVGMERFETCFCDVPTDQLQSVGNEDCMGGDSFLTVYRIDVTAVVRGDPHMKTFDGRRYSYQGLCWHTLFKDCSENDAAFEVTAKFEPTVDRTKTRTVSVNVTVGNEYAIVDQLNVITGQTTGFVSEPRRIQVQEDGKTISFIFKSKDTTFTLNWTLLRHVFEVSFEGSDYNGRMCGLLGNADGEGSNDFVKPDGTIVSDVDEFGKSWKVYGKTCD